MIQTKRNLVAMFIVITTLTYYSAVQATGDIIFPKISEWQVTVTNGLAADRTLSVHCRSKEDDLGVRNLMSEESFTWGFRENVIHTTLFWCYMSRDGDGAHVRMNVFWDDVILFHRCGWKNCVWIARDDGVYLRDSVTGQDMISQKWEFGL